MQLTDQAIFLQIDPYREQDALVTAFGREQGVLRGMVRYGMSSRHRGTYCTGNLVDLSWQGRLEEHLGTLRCELLIPSGAMLMAKRQCCYALQSACSLIRLAFEQRDPHPHLFRALELLIESMRFDLPWLADYARFEAILLREAGYGLGLEECIATGERSHLQYLSPKSGCAVSEQAGRPYHDKLLSYPDILTQEMHVSADSRSVQVALAATGHFLERWLLAALDKPMPAVRQRLLATIEQRETLPA